MIDDISPKNIEIIPAKFKIVIPDTSSEMMQSVAGASVGSDAFVKGEGDAVCIMDSNGLYVGSATFASAPFRVTMAGAVTASSITLSGGTISYGKTSFTDSTNAGYWLSNEGWYVGAATDTTKFKYSIATGLMDLVGTISSRSTATIASAINSSGNFIDSNLNTSTKTILTDFTFNSTDYSGAFKTGDITWNASTGAITGGSGALFNKNGLVFATAGVATITLDGVTGSANFAGTLASGMSITSPTITGGTIQTGLSGERIVITGTTVTAYDSSNNLIGIVNGSSFSSPAVLVANPRSDVRAIALLSEDIDGVAPVIWAVAKGYQSVAYLYAENASNPNPVIDITNAGTGKDIDGHNSNWSVTSAGDATFNSLDVAFEKLKLDCLADTGAADAYVITPSPAITSYEEGQIFLFKSANANTTVSTLNVNSKGPINIVKRNKTALVSGDIGDDMPILVVYTSNSGYTIDSYSETYNDDGYVLYSGSTGYYGGAGQSFTPDVSYKVTSSKFYLKKSGSPTGTAVVKIWNGTGGVPANQPTFTMKDSYSESNQNTNYALYTGTRLGTAQSFSAVGGGTLGSAKFYIYKHGSPTGTVVAKLYAHSGTYGTDSIPTGTALATSDPILVSSLAVDADTLYNFHFTGVNQITLTETYYVIAIEFTSTSSDVNNYVGVGADNSSPSHGGNISNSVDGSTWTATAGVDAIFYVYTRVEGTGLLGTAGTLDVSTLTTDYALTTFTFTGAQQAAITGGNDYIMTIEYSSGDSTNYILVGSDSSVPTHTGSSCTSTVEAWSAVAGTDLNFYIYGTAECFNMLNPVATTYPNNWLTASDTLQISADTERSRATASMAKAKEIQIKLSGTVRCNYDYKSSDSAGSVHTQLYKNGVAIGADRDISSNVYATSSEDFSFVVGDLIQVYYQGDGSRSAYVKNFRLYYTESSITTFATVNTD